MTTIDNHINAKFSELFFNSASSSDSDNRIFLMLSKTFLFKFRITDLFIVLKSHIFNLDSEEFTKLTHMVKNLTWILCVDMNFYY